MSLSVADKLKIAARLDELGVGVVEGGWPGSNPKDIEFFERAKELPWTNARLSAFGATRRPGGDTAADLATILDAGTPIVCLVGKAHPLQVTEALGTTLAENIAMVADSVAHVVAQGRECVFDAEHFFDGYDADPEYAVSVLRAAVEAGASTVVLCDTNGGALPDRVATVFDEVSAVIDVALGCHFHNDAGCAVANSLVAVAHGATHVQGTVNGIGERCGNANILTIIADLALKMGVEVLPPERVQLLTDVHFAVAEICNLTPDPQQPFVGASAFVTKAGLHSSGLAKMAGAYEHIEPQAVGNERRLLVGELSGRSTIVAKASDIGLDLTARADLAQAILDDVKDLEHRGYHFEAADASLELLMRRKAGEALEYFTLESFRVLTEKRGDHAVSEATVKIAARGERHLETAEGNGPVHALDGALRRALGRAYPALAHIELVDYKVRILADSAGTDAVTRVLLDSRDAHHEWTTIGVSPNIIEASWQALVDSLTYGLHKAGEKP